MSTWKTNRKLITIPCQQCGLDFEKTLSEYNRSNKLGRKHFCSHKCSSENNILQTKKCLCCGEEFAPTHARSKYCSKSCAAKITNKNRKGKKRLFSEEGLSNLRKSALINLHSGGKIKINRYCKHCNEIIQTKSKVFCSISCKREYDRRNLSEYQIYRRECQFKFNLSDFPDEFNFTLIENHGWYKAKNKGNNLNGVSRDHMVSISYGFKNKINPNIIGHPANCELMIHNNNSKKHSKCTITLNELLLKIKEWNIKYK